VGVVWAKVAARAVEVRDYTTGFVFRYAPHVIYVKDETGGARVEIEESRAVRSGDLVEVSGFPAVTPGKPILRNAVLRVVGSTREPTPVAVAAESVLSADHDAELVRLDAQLLGALTTSTERVLVLKTRTGDTAFEAGLDRARDGEDLDQI